MKLYQFALLALLFISFVAPAAAQDSAAKEAAKVISHEEVYNFCRTLASPEYEGRYASHQGHLAAAKWVASMFKEWGLKPFDEEVGFLQPHACSMTLQDEAEMTLLLPVQNRGSQTELSYREVALEVESEFMPFLFCASGEGEAEIVFAGWGASAPEAGYDDYANIDVHGKFVLLFRGSPSSDDPKQREELAKHRRSFHKTARDKGALGILYVYSKEPIAYTGTNYVPNYCPFLVSEKVVDMLLEEKETTFSRLRQDLVNFQKPISFPLKAKVRYRVKSRHFGGTSHHVVGYVEGSDPELKKECFFLFAHIDHAGPHLGRVFPGAHDNASGCAVVMELAKAFATAPKKPKRSIAFILFTAEEVGVGPRYFTDNIPKQFSKIDGVFNYDMVGVGDYVSFNLNALPEEFKTLILKADKPFGIVRDSNGPIGSSRVYPYLYFASAGGHSRFEHYHRSSDTIYRINHEIMANIARVSLLSIYPWADRLP